MKPMKRDYMNAKGHAYVFNNREGRTKAINLVGGGFRGGIRL